jgi:hypothetical protein
MISQHVLTATLVATVGGLASLVPADAGAQALPTPRALVSGLDLECYKTPGPALNINVNLTHLNPVLLGLGLPPHQVVIREQVQTCVPVRKNNVNPAPAALPFIRHIDFACYRVDAAPLANPVPLNLAHLNPVLAGQPAHAVRLVQPAQLCMPVRKNAIVPPPAVLALARFVDLECYRAEPQPHPPFTVGLSQLNPQLTGIPPHPMALVSSPRQLCVPVRKNAQVIPPAILNLVRWIDLEKFAAQPNATIAPVNVVLQHLNPLFAGRPPVTVTLREANSLLVPVAKNGMVPPAN